MMKKVKWAMFAALAALIFCQCKKDDRKIDESYNPEILPANFTNSTSLNNVYFRFDPGTKYIFDGEEHIEVQRSTATKTVQGIAMVVVNDKVWENGKLVEDTDDWFAQDNDGNVWYFGEEVDNYDASGNLEDHDGSWEAGVDGAKAGIVMLANPKLGDAYRQEYYFNEAEDEAEVVEVGLTVTVPYGTFENCIKTKDFTALEPGVLEYKFYAPGIGVIKEVDAKTGETKAELVEIEN